MNQKITFINELFQELNLKNVEYCVIKGFENHPYYKNDIDIFLRECDFDYLEKIVLSFKSKYNFKLSIPSRMSGNIKDASPKILFLLFSDSQTHSLLRIELFPGLYYSGQVLFNSKLILSHRRFNHLLQIYTCPSDLIALITLLSFHKSLSFSNLVSCSLISNKQIKQRKFLLSELNKHLQGSNNSILHLLTSNLQHIFSLIQQSSYRSFFALAHLLKLRLFLRSLICQPIYCLETFIQKLFWDFQRTFFQPFSFVYKTNADMHVINIVRKRLLDEGFSREIVVCNSPFKLLFDLKIRDQRSKEAIVIFISSTAIKHDLNNMYFSIANSYMSFIDDKC